MSKPTKKRDAMSPSEFADLLDPESGSGEWVVTCRSCRRELVVETANVNDYLKKGWPKCCGKDMLPSIRPVGD